MAEVTLYRPAELDRVQWRTLQMIAGSAYIAELDRSEAEIDALIEFDDFDRYYVSHNYPNAEVGKRYNPNQSYSRPRVAVATLDNKPIGYAYSADNVSGATKAERQRKRLSIVKNYLWLREVVVHPDHQRQGVAKQLGRTLLKDAIAFQPVSAYIWPDEIDFLQKTLEGLNFRSTGEQMVNAFGDTSEPIRQVRMQADTARGVLERIS